MANYLSPHDAFFRKNMHDIRIAHSFFKHNLPINILDVVNLKTLKICQDTHVDQDLSSKMMDLLYSVEFNGELGFIYILTEHQSNPDVLMPFRILQYVCSIMDKHLKKGNKKLPIVYPIVFYHGPKTPYPYSTKIFDNFAKKDKELAMELMFKGFQLIDIGQTGDDEILKHEYAATMEILQKHIRNRDMCNHIGKLLDSGALQLTIQNNSDYLRAMIKYIFVGAKVQNYKKVLRVIVDSMPSTSEDIMTIEEYILQKGRKQGKQQGMQQGELLGVQKVASNLLKQNLPIDMIVEATGLSARELQQM